MKCNGGQTDNPCDAALATLPRDSRTLAAWRGNITCPVCNNTWRGDYWSLDRWPGDHGSAFDYRRVEVVAGISQVI